MTIKNSMCAVIGVIGSVISTLFGGWNAALTTLIIFMAIDYLSGVVVAGVFHKSNKSKSGGLKSTIGWQGICRKGITLAIVLIACRLDLLLDTSYVKDAVVIGFCVNELISIVENESKDYEKYLKKNIKFYVFVLNIPVLAAQE